MRRVSTILTAFMVLFILNGCLSRAYLNLSPSLALLYSHTIQPLDTNMNRTPFPERKGKGDIKHLEYQVSVEWDSNAIGDIAKENGMETVYFADMEILSVLGIWQQKTVHIYGK